MEVYELAAGQGEEVPCPICAAIDCFFSHRPTDEPCSGTPSVDTIGALLGKSDSSSTSVLEALAAALANHEGGLGDLVQKFEGAGLGGVISPCRGKLDAALSRGSGRPSDSSRPH
jgi:hypothetical protein